MQKPLLITIAIVILLLALGSWAYLFFFGAPQDPDEFFTDLGIGLTTQQVVPVASEDAEVMRLEIVGSSLQQLTLRPVAGFVGVTTSIVRYVEQGTGHIYEINLDDGSEVRISNTTLPQIQTAVFDRSGEQVVLQAYGQTPNAVIGTIVNGGLSTRSLPPTAQNVTFTSSTTIAYTISTQGETTGYIYDTTTDSQTIEFIVPFGSVVAHYTLTGTYVSNRHTPELEGTLWSVAGRTFTQVSINAFGFMVELGPSWYSMAFTEDNTYQSRAVNVNTNEVVQLPVSFIPEKCDWGVNTLWCAAPFEPIGHTYVKDWYQGTIRANDALWIINPASETAELAVNPVTEIGRQLDITNLTQLDLEQLLFTNRQDNTLWLYDRAR